MSAPTAPHDTSSISYGGAPASTTTEVPAHGDGAAAPWAAAHARAFAEIETFEDLVYGRVLGAALLADIARPKITPGASPTPAIVSIHGGCWRGGHKRDTSTIVVTQWAQQFGFFAMSIDYRLAGGAAPPACYQDVQCALRYVHANAAEHNVDPSKVFVIGQSAGGHLAALCGTLGGSGPFEKTGGWEDAPSTVAASIPVAGPFVRVLHPRPTCSSVLMPVHWLDRSSSLPRARTTSRRSSSFPPVPATPPSTTPIQPRRGGSTGPRGRPLSCRVEGRMG